MKASEFVKKYGWSDARFYLSTASDDAVWISFDMPEHGIDNIIINVAELKRLVESHELVGNFGGIKRAKRILKKSYTSFNTIVSVVWNDKPFQCTIEQLEQAILDVESYQ